MDRRASPPPLLAGAVGAALALLIVLGIVLVLRRGGDEDQGVRPAATGSAVLVTTTPTPGPAETATATPSPSPSPTPTPIAATPSPPPAATVSGPFPAATVLPGAIDSMMGGRFTTPRPGDMVTAPIAVSGFANAFEGAVQIVLRDKEGREAGRTSATGRMGEFGEFNVSLNAPVSAAAAPYTLEMTVASPRDGAVTVIAQVPVGVGGQRPSGALPLSGGPLPAPISLSQPRIRHLTADGFEVEFVSGSMCQGGVFFPSELAGLTIGTTQARDEQRLATYHVVAVNARILSRLVHGTSYRWYITCENPQTAPPSPESRVSLPFDLAVP